MTAAAMPPSHRRAISVLKLLGVIFLLLMLVCGGVITWVAMNWRGWTAGVMEAGMLHLVEESHLPDDQKQAVRANIARMTADFRDKKIGGDQLFAFFARLSEGPFMDLVVMETLRARYDALIGPLDEERAEVDRVFERFQRGIVEGAIPSDTINTVLAPVSEVDQHGIREVHKYELSARDLEALVERMREEADEAGIPDERYEVNFAALVQDAVDAVYGEGRTEPDADQ